MPASAPMLCLANELLLHIFSYIAEDIPASIMSNSISSALSTRTLCNLALTCKLFAPLVEDILLNAPSVSLTRYERATSFLELLAVSPSLRMNIKLLRPQRYDQYQCMDFQGDLSYPLMVSAQAGVNHDGVDEGDFPRSLFRLLTNLREIALAPSSSSSNRLPNGDGWYLKVRDLFHTKALGKSLCRVKKTEDSTSVNIEGEVCIQPEPPWNYVSYSQVPKLMFELSIPETLTTELFNTRLVTELRVGYAPTILRRSHQCDRPQPSLHALWHCLAQLPNLKSLTLYDSTTPCSKDIGQRVTSSCSCPQHSRPIDFNIIIDLVTDLCPRLHSLSMPENWYITPSRTDQTPLDTRPVWPLLERLDFTDLRSLTVPKCALIYNGNRSNVLLRVLPRTVRLLKITQADFDVFYTLYSLMESKKPWSFPELEEVELYINTDKFTGRNKRKKARSMFESQIVRDVKDAAAKNGVKITLACPYWKANLCNES
ncbi:hypothetical protein BKA66DRAFT_443243 [Pyrenochaeta sp. MPI-SDFR-AT-0127]|nr:hypothetical protein BKA66DRAFT_443243 [Pyrenochaeta sp. MPI-SDFR-AT-0127]